MLETLATLSALVTLMLFLHSYMLEAIYQDALHGSKPHHHPAE
jgi:hypothetical protein